MENKKIRVAIYCRVATDGQAETALEAQRARLRAYAEEQGYNVVKEIAEVAKGNTLCRPRYPETLRLGPPPRHR